MPNNTETHLKAIKIADNVAKKLLVRFYARSDSTSAETKKALALNWNDIPKQLVPEYIQYLHITLCEELCKELN